MESCRFLLTLLCLAFVWVYWPMYLVLVSDPVRRLLVPNLLGWMALTGPQYHHHHVRWAIAIRAWWHWPGLLRGHLKCHLARHFDKRAIPLHWGSPSGTPGITRNSLNPSASLSSLTCLCPFFTRNGLRRMQRREKTHWLPVWSFGFYSRRHHSSALGVLAVLGISKCQRSPRRTTFWLFGTPASSISPVL